MSVNRRTVEVTIFSGKTQAMSKIKLDTAKYDNIGMTDESLAEYLKPIVGDGSYYLSNDRINGETN